MLLEEKKMFLFVQNAFVPAQAQIEGDIALAVWPMTTAFFSAREYNIV
jgi:hypothetical protein